MLLVALLLAWSASPLAAEQPLADLGTNNLTILDFTGSYSQGATTLTFNSVSFGDYVFGEFSSSYNWSGVASFGLFLSAPGDSPDVYFKVEFYDSTLSFILNEYEGFASGLTASPTFVPLMLAVPGTGNLSDVGYFFFGWNGSGPGAVVLHSIAGSVPPVVWSSAGGRRP